MKSQLTKKSMMNQTKKQKNCVADNNEIEEGETDGNESESNGDADSDHDDVDVINF